MAEPPYPSVADGLYLGWYPLAYLAVLLLLRARVQRFLPSMWLDGVVAGLGAAALVGGFLLDDLLSLGGASTAEALTNLAYPLSDLLLVLVLVAGCAVLGLRASRTLLFVVAGLSLTTAGDVLYLLQESAGAYVEGGPTDLLWLLGVTALAFAPGSGAELPPTSDPARENARLGLPVLALPGAAALLSLGVLVLGHARPVPVLAALLAAASVLAAFARVALTFRDVRAREQADFSAVLHQARTDELTGLPNRRGLFEACEQLAASATPDRPGSLVVLDLDRFKEINDSLGHAAGDDLLCQVASRLGATLGADAVVARLGGDEFAAVLRHQLPRGARGRPAAARGAGRRVRRRGHAAARRRQHRRRHHDRPPDRALGPAAQRRRRDVRGQAPTRGRGCRQQRGRRGRP